MKKLLLFLIGVITGCLGYKFIMYKKDCRDYDIAYNEGVIDMKEYTIKEMKKWYFNSDIQNAKYDPCVVDSMTDLSIRTVCDTENILLK